MSNGGIAHSLTSLLAVIVILVAFAAFFVSFLIAPLIVMVVSYTLLVLVDRRHTPAAEPTDKPGS
jgi:hypothetical protein